jgi:biotin carboxyl carrier protein
MSRLATNMFGRTFKVTLDARGDGVPTAVTIDGKTLEILWSPRHGVLSVTNEHGVERHYPVRAAHVSRYAGEAEVTVHAELWTGGASGTQGVAATLHPEVSATGALGDGGHGGGAGGIADKIVRSPITGKVLKVLVKTGEAVQAGQALVIVEAMKMENRVFAPVAGVVKAVAVAEGDAVTTGKELARLGAGAAK